MTRGRPPVGPALANKVEGSEQAKLRLKVILQTLAGELTIPDACAQLGIAEARFHALRTEWLQAACAALEPKPLGRPKELTVEEETQLLRLHRENIDLKIHLRAAQIRERIAIHMPHLLRQSQTAEDPQKKRR